MKNYLSKIVFIMAFAVLSVPHIIFAAWWNPTTWFTSVKVDERPIIEANTKKVESQTAPTTQPAIIEKEIITEVPIEKTTEKIIDKPVEKIVTKTVTNTITVDNPSLIKQIEALKIERDNWKLSFENVSKDKDILNKKITSLSDNIARYQKEIGEWNSKYTILSNKFQEISSNPIDMEVLKTKMVEAQRQIDLDKEVNEILSNLNDPLRTCVGRPSKVFNEANRASAQKYDADRFEEIKSNRLQNPALDKACKSMGY